MKKNKSSEKMKSLELSHILLGNAAFAILTQSQREYHIKMERLKQEQYNKDGIYTGPKKKSHKRSSL